MVEYQTLFTFLRRGRAAQFVTRPLLCMCVTYSGDEATHWRPCPSSLCERRSHAFVHRVSTSGRDYRYDGLRAWLRWIVSGTAADEDDV